MNAEIIAVGSEMLTPQRVDTNSLYLTGELNNLGVEVVAKSIIGDDLDRLATAIRDALDRSEILILSGGLGPTEDDLTREAIAQALDRKLYFDPAIADALEERFARLGRKMSEVNKRQAFVVEGARVLVNDRGSAPGQWIEDSGRIAILLPGPPHELKAMFERQALPLLHRAVPKSVISTLQLRVTGMPESDLDQLISPVYKKYTNPVTTILAANGDLQVHFRARCESIAEADALLAEVAGPIELLLGDKLYSRNGDPLDLVVGNMLRQRHATVSVAESMTGGMLGERFTNAAGSSDYFKGGFLTYSNAMKMELPRRAARDPRRVRGRQRRDRGGNGHRSAAQNRIDVCALHHGPRGTGRGRGNQTRGHSLRRRGRRDGSARHPPRLQRRSPTHPHFHLPDGPRRPSPPPHESVAGRTSLRSTGRASLRSAGNVPPCDRGVAAAPRTRLNLRGESACLECSILGLCLAI